ncbi:MAG: TetR/AcrR family transcriptional regulator [Pseudomonadales bacterium]|nr:TetR/AcrR family transcriptional regulator [Pseudomonadales bacterium]
MNNEPSRLDLKREKTRSTLVLAAKQLVFEREYQKISIQDITDKAQLGLGTFYNYFETKNDVYKAVLEELKAKFNQELDGIRAPLVDPATIISVTTQYCLREAQDNREWHEFLAFSGLKGEYILRQDEKQCRNDIEKGASSGRFKVQDVDFTTQLIIGMLNHVTREIAEKRLKRSAMAETTRHILRMLGIPDPVAKALTQAPLPPMAAPKKSSSDADSAFIHSASH